VKKMVERGEFLGCHVSPELYRAVVAEAKRRGVSVSEMIREALTHYLASGGENVERLRDEIEELRAKLNERDREIEELRRVVRAKERELEELREVLCKVEERSKLSEGCASRPAVALKGISDRLKSYRCYLAGVRGGEDLIPLIRKLIEQAAYIIDSTSTS